MAVIRAIARDFPIDGGAVSTQYFSDFGNGIALPNESGDHIPLFRGELVILHVEIPIPPRKRFSRVSQLASLNSMGVKFRVALTL